MFSAFRPFRPFDAFRVPLGGELTPEKTPEVELVTSEGDLFFTADDEQLVVQEA
jgi:hypothetical protein